LLIDNKKFQTSLLYFRKYYPLNILRRRSFLTNNNVSERETDVKVVNELRQLKDEYYQMKVVSQLEEFRDNYYQTDIW